MHSVQPDHIDIRIKSESALAWVQTHWGQASSLKLAWVKSDIPWVMAHNAASVTSLKCLELYLKEERSPTTAMLLTWLLAQAPQLQLLTVQHPTTLVVPPMRNLSHLIMASTDFTPMCAASIKQLRNLQTLWLGVVSLPHPPISCADFDLASLPRLTDVCVFSLPMPRLILPKQCRLHLKGDEEDVFLDTWDVIARQGQLQSIFLRPRHQGLIPETFLDEMPSFLLKSKCSFLNWWGITELREPSSPSLFDAAHFSCLTHLKLMGRVIHILLPQELPLQVLHVQATSLSIVCVNPQEQAKRLQQVRLTYRALGGADVFVLLGAMCGMGAMVSKVDAVQPGFNPDGHHGFLVSYERVPALWTCPCGACLDCVRKKMGC